MDANQLLELLYMGRLTVYPLGVASVLVLAITLERMLRFRGIEKQSRKLTRDSIELLVRRDIEGARSLAEKSKTPIADVYLEAMRWKNIALEDLQGILTTSRQELAQDLKRGLWIVGTIGSLAPYVGLFGTVVGIIRAFQDMAEHGAGGFEIVAAGISEALVATAAGLFVAIVALLFFNYLQVRVGAIAQTYARSCERFVQALLFLESSSEPGEEERVPSGSFVPAD
ncbi:MAG: MotA/TolQ/ExbB proton channel family protein [Myxococcota bacterium]